MKDITKIKQKWYVIDNQVHIKVKDFDLGIELMKNLSKKSNGKSLIMLSEKEYYSRYTKRGKKSMK